MELICTLILPLIIAKESPFYDEDDHDLEATLTPPMGWVISSQGAAGVWRGLGGKERLHPV